MAGILGLASQQGSLAQGISDDSLEQNTDRDVRNRAIKEENKDAAWNIAGRATAAAGQAIKDGKVNGKGFDENFKDNLFNPYSKYTNLRRVLRGQDPVAPIPGYAGPQSGPHSAITGENADVSGAIINNMVGGRWSGGA